MLSSAIDLKLIVVSLPVAFWMGYFIEQWFRQAATYHLLGRAAKKDISPNYAEKCVKESFGNKDWIILSSAMSLTFFSLGLISKSSQLLFLVLALGFIAAILFLWFSAKAIKSYNAAFAQLEKEANRRASKANDPF